MKTILTLFLFFTFIFSIQAQQFKGRIYGKISSEDQHPIEFANIALYHVGDSIPLKGVISDHEGNYLLEGLAEGEYTLMISQLGFEKKLLPGIVISQEKPDFKQDIPLKEDRKVLESVEVKADRALIEMQSDKMVMNLENTIIGSGMTASEILKRAPGVTLDKDGGLNLKGKSQVMVMIDDKPMYLSGAQVGTLLKSLPANQIASVEIITSPSAKYDAAGNAGIVNIKLKKGAYDGMNGSVNLNAGQGFYPKFSTGVSIFYKKNGLRLSGNYDYAYRENYVGFDNKRYFRDGNGITNTIFDQSAFYKNPNTTHSFKIQADYTLKDKHSFYLNFGGLDYKADWIGGNISNVLDANEQLTNVYRTKDQSVDQWGNFNGGTGYSFLLDEKGSEISLKADFNYYDQYNTQFLQTNYFDNKGNISQPDYLLNGIIPTKVLQQSYKFDFSKKIGENSKIETGAKVNLISTDNNIRYLKSDGSIDTSSSNYFLYNEHIWAGYVSFSHKMGKFSLQGGIRMEHTRSEGDQKTSGQKFTRDYTNWFPNLSLGYDINEQQSLNFQYSSRIDRPDYQSLNPFIYYFDAFSNFKGNPYLLPQLTHNFELNYSFFGGALISTLNYTQTNQVITEVYEQNLLAQTFSMTSKNINTLQNYGISLALNLPINKWWNTSNYVYVYNNVYRGNYLSQNFNNQAVAFNITSTQTFSLPYGIEFELSGIYESANVNGIGRNREMYMIGLGLQKNLMKERAVLKLNCSDILWSYVWRDRAVYQGIDTQSMYKWDNRVLTLSLVYNFGKNITKLLGVDKIKGGDDDDLQKGGKSR